MWSLRFGPPHLHIQLAEAEVETFAKDIPGGLAQVGIGWRGHPALQDEGKLMQGSWKGLTSRDYTQHDMLLTNWELSCILPT